MHGVQMLLPSTIANRVGRSRLMMITHAFINMINKIHEYMVPSGDLRVAATRCANRGTDVLLYNLLPGNNWNITYRYHDFRDYIYLHDTDDIMTLSLSMVSNTGQLTSYLVL